MADDIHYVKENQDIVCFEKRHQIEDKTLTFIYWIFYYKASWKMEYGVRPFGVDFLIGCALIAGQTVILR